MLGREQLFFLLSHLPKSTGTQSFYPLTHILFLTENLFVAPVLSAASLICIPKRFDMNTEQSDGTNSFIICCYCLAPNASLILSSRIVRV